MKITKTRKGLRRAIALAAVATLLPVLASAQVPAAVEGRIQAVTINADQSVDMTVMGIAVHVPAAIFTGGLATTPTGTLAGPNDLLGASLPGRSDAGFLNGTAIINGESTTTTAADGSLVPGFVAADLFVEAAENVVLGAIQNDGNCGLSIEGVPLRFLDDPRMQAADPVNTSGFLIDACQTTNGGAAAVEGYYGEDGVFHIFVYESDDAPLLDTGEGGTTTVTRALCDGRRIEVRGSSTLEAGEARLYALGALIGSDALVLDPVTNTSSYRIRVNIATCPAEVTVESWANGAQAPDSSVTAPVDIK